MRFAFIRAEKGFTLLELLVSLAIFALIGAMAYGGLHTIFKARNNTELHAKELQGLQLLYRKMQRDVEQFIARPVRNEFGDTIAAIVLDDEGMIELTRSGWSNPLQQPRSSLQRVAWFVRDEQLIRRHWLVLDRAQDSEPLDRPLLDGVQEFSVRLMSDDEQWHTQWPPLSETKAKSKIIAVEFEFELPSWQRITWLFQTP